jgi:cupin fold WbuC family metalloprotein
VTEETARYRRETPEVYFAEDPFHIVGERDMTFLKRRAAENVRLRARLCLHPGVADRLHDMILVFRGDTYFRPLRHRERPQAFEVLEGAIYLVVLDDFGDPVRVFDVAARPADSFMMRISAGHWYSFIIRSEWLIIRETAPGPMIEGEREYAPFSPAEGTDEAASYAASLRSRVECLLKTSAYGRADAANLGTR